MTTASVVFWVGVFLVSLPIYAAIGALTWRYLNSRWRSDDFPINEFAGVVWPVVLPVYLLIVWPIKVALRLPSWLATRRTARAVPRATKIVR